MLFYFFFVRFLLCLYLTCLSHVWYKSYISLLDEHYGSLVVAYTWVSINPTMGLISGVLYDFWMKEKKKNFAIFNFSFLITIQIDSCCEFYHSHSSINCNVHSVLRRIVGIFWRISICLNVILCEFIIYLITSFNFGTKNIY